MASQSVYEKKKNTHCRFNNPPSAHSKGKSEGAPEWNFYRLRKWIMGRVAWIKTDQFLQWPLVFFLRQFLGEKQKQRKGETGKKVEEERKEKQREREREREKEKRRVRKRRRKVEEEREEGSGVARNPASTLDWNLKVPGSTLREIIHPKTTGRIWFLAWTLIMLFRWILMTCQPV